MAGIQGPSIFSITSNLTMFYAPARVFPSRAGQRGKPSCWKSNTGSRTDQPAPQITFAADASQDGRRNQGKFVLGEKCRVDKRSASTMPTQKGGCAALIHPTTFDCTRFIKNQSSLIFRTNLQEQIYPDQRPG